MLKLILTDSKIRDKVFPYLDLKIFDNFGCKEIVKKIKQFESKYDSFPSFKDLKLFIDKKDVYEELDNINNLDISDYKNEFVLDNVKEFIKGKLIFNYLALAHEKLNDGNLDDIGPFADKLKEANSFSFDDNVGLDLFSDEGEQLMYEHLHSEDECIPTGILGFDEMIRGGLHRKSVTVFVAQSNLGKTLIKCAVAANMILNNQKVVYVTCELSEPYVGERILQNMFNVDRDRLGNLSREEFGRVYKKFKEKIKNNLIIKKYGAGKSNVNHLKMLFKELHDKKKFVPDILLLDYLGIFGAYGATKNSNSNDIGKLKCQELEAFAYEYDVPVLTSAQSNRSGYGRSDIDPTHIADAIGIFTETDVVIGVTQTEELRELDPPQFTWLLLKNRFGLNLKQLQVGICYEKMKLYNLDSDGLVIGNSKELEKDKSDKIESVSKHLDEQFGIGKKKKVMKDYLEIEE